MKTPARLLVLAAGCALTLSVHATADQPPGAGRTSATAGNVEQDVARRADGPPLTADALRGTFTVTGWVVATAITDEAVWAIVAVPQRGVGRPPTQSLVRSDIPSGRVADLGNIGGFAGGALLVAEGSVWAAEGLGGEKVHRVDANSGKIVASVDVPRNPTALTYGAGSIWVTAAEKVTKAGGVLLGVRGLAVHRIDPAANKVMASVPLSLPEPPANRSGSAGVEFSGGAVWACDALSGTVVRIDPASERVVATIEAPQADSSDARRYSYWLHAAGDRLLLRRYGSKVSRTVGAAPITDVTLWRIDPETNRLSGEPAQLVRDGVVLGFADGVAWIGNTQADGLTRVDPATLKALAPPIMIGHPVYAIAGGGGSLLALGGAGPAALASASNPGKSWVKRFSP
jgi:hypothetical protein